MLSLDRVTPYDAGKSLETLKRELGLDTDLRLSANENPLGPSPRWWTRSGARPRRPPLPRRRRHRAAGCARPPPRRAADPIVIGNGADELIGMVALAALDPGDEIVVPTRPSSPTPRRSRWPARGCASPLGGYEPDLDDVLARSRPDQGVILCSPHNPATTIIRRAPLTVPRGPRSDPPLVVLDEAYGDFCDDPDIPTASVLQHRYPR